MLCFLSHTHPYVRVSLKEMLMYGERCAEASDSLRAYGQCASENVDNYERHLSGFVNRLVLLRLLLNKLCACGSLHKVLC